jgi:hypothetical protein
MKKKILSLGLALALCVGGTSAFAKSKGGVEYPQVSELVPQTQNGGITPQHYTTCIGKTDVYKSSTSVVSSYGYTQCSDKQERISVLNTLYRNNTYVSSDQDVQYNSISAYAEGGNTTYYSSYSYKSDSHHNSTHDGVTSGTYTVDSSL